MAHLDLFSAGAAYGDINRSPDQRANQRSFVVGRAAHIRLRIGGGAGSFGCRGKCSLGNWLPAQGRFGLFRFDGGQSDAAQPDGSILANISIHGELHGSASRGIDRSGTLECEIGSPASPRWNLDHNFAD